jgi:hypothetical protein
MQAHLHHLKGYAMPAAKNAKVTQQRVMELLHYDCETGVFTNRTTRGMAIKDAVAGTISKNGYQHIVVDGCRVLAHRLAWLYVTGAWPEKNIDHINRNRADNRFKNLREANQSENMQNAAVPSHSKSGVIGVCWDASKQRWMAHIKIQKKHIFLGRFREKDEAINARLSAEEKYHPFRTGNDSIISKVSA